MAQQKLYTEEQVRNAFVDGMKFIAVHPLKYEQDANEYMDSLTPIELPSDDEIEDKGKWVFNDAGHTIFTHYNTVPSWVEGAKWMKEQIKGGNK